MPEYFGSACAEEVFRRFWYHAERGNEDEAGDESQNPRCGTDFISGVSSCARLFSVFCRRIREKKLFW